MGSLRSQVCDKAQLIDERLMLAPIQLTNLHRLTSSLAAVRHRTFGAVRAIFSSALR
jgi:hypothetical protein